MNSSTAPLLSKKRHQCLEEGSEHGSSTKKVNFVEGTKNDSNSESDSESQQRGNDKASSYEDSVFGDNFDDCAAHVGSIESSMLSDESMTITMSRLRMTNQYGVPLSPILKVYYWLEAHEEEFERQMRERSEGCGSCFMSEKMRKRSINYESGLTLDDKKKRVLLRIYSNSKNTYVASRVSDDSSSDSD